MRAYWVSIQGSTMALQCQDIGLCAGEPSLIVYYTTIQRSLSIEISGNRRPIVKILDI